VERIISDIRVTGEGAIDEALQHSTAVSSKKQVAFKD
jgi:hypothetical protein